MNILFVSSGNKKQGISPIIKKQGESISKKNHEIDFFTIKGKGIKGYILNVIPLYKKLKSKKSAMQFEYNLKKNRKIRKQLIEKFISTTVDC